MKLLIVTQSIDKNNSILGFFVNWVKEFSKHFEKVTVICLEKGEYNLPENVKVLSLGKEKGGSKINYVINFLHYIWRERKNYDSVFVHMNQEYILLAGDLWHMMGKKVYLWRNHAKGGMLTRVAVQIADKVFYTSPQSFTAQFAKSVQMPVGIDTDLFKPNPSVEKIPNSALFLGRISPVKKVLEFIDWVKSTNHTATIAGPILSQDKEYGELVKHRMFDIPAIKYVGPVDQNEARKLYQSHETYVNLTPAGSFDKTILEAAACGCKLVVDNPAARNLNIEEHSLKKLMSRLAQEIR